MTAAGIGLFAPDALGHGDHRQPFEQGLVEFRIALRADRNIPAIVRSETSAFYRILFGHQHRQILAKAQIRRLEGMMIGKRMFDETQAGVAQMIEKPSRIADAGHGVDHGLPEVG